jgi:cell division protein FtsL
MSAFITQTSLEDTICLLGKRNVNLSLDNLELNRRLHKARATVHQLRKERRQLNKIIKELNRVGKLTDVSFDCLWSSAENPNKP